MRKELKLLFLEIVLTIIIILMFIVMINVNKDFGFFKFVSLGNIMAEHNKVTTAVNNYESAREKYNSSLDNLNKEKESYTFEKNKYLAISEDTLNMVKEATTDEKFDVEYMWITLGNYAKRNNLNIYLLEPGGVQEVQEVEKVEEDKEETSEGKDTPITGNVNDKENKENKDKKDKDNKNEQEILKPEDSIDINNEFKIKVEGSYINLAEFVFNIENDKALRFKLDKISMKLISGTKVEANFVVKNLKLTK